MKAIQLEAFGNPAEVLKLVEVLDDHDDVHNVYGNYELSDALIAKLAG